MGQFFSRRRFYVRLVEENQLPEFVWRVRGMGDIFAGTVEQFKYFLIEDNKFYEIVEKSTGFVVGTVCVVASGDTGVLGGITMEKSLVDSKTLFPLDEEILNDIRDAVPYLSINVPEDINFENDFGKYKWKIREYRLDFDDIVKPGEPPNLLQVEILKDQNNIEEIVRADYSFFRISTRTDFLSKWIKRSDVVCLVRSEVSGKLVGFGMLSKEIYGKRLLGPVFVPGYISALLVVATILYYAKVNLKPTEIIAYAPEGSLGNIPLTSNNFKMTSKVWDRKVTSEVCKISVDYIVALSSLVFQWC